MLINITLRSKCRCWPKSVRTLHPLHEYIFHDITPFVLVLVLEHDSVSSRKTAPLAAKCADYQDGHQVGDSISTRSLAAHCSNELAWENDLLRRVKDYCFKEASSNSSAS